MFLPVAFLILGLTLLGMTGIDLLREENIRAAAAVIGLLLVSHVVLTWRSRRADQLLFPVTAMLVSIGLVIISRLAPELAIRQSLWIALGVIVFAGTVSFLPSVSVLQNYKYTSAVLGLVLVGTTFLFGIDLNGSGARLWLGAGGLYYQPSEILKVLLVIFLAGYLEDKRELLAWSFSPLGRLRLPPLPYLGPLLVMWAISMVMLVAQRDLGAALLLFGVFLAMLYIASSRASYVWAGLASFLAGGYLAFLAFSPRALEGGHLAGPVVASLRPGLPGGSGIGGAGSRRHARKRAGVSASPTTFPPFGPTT